MNNSKKAGKGSAKPEAEPTTRAGAERPAMSERLDAASTRGGVSRMVDAPGKRHRKPPPQEVINKRMGEPVGKQMGQKSVKNRMSRGRG